MSETKEAVQQRISSIKRDVSGYDLLELLAKGKKIADNRCIDTELQSKVQVKKEFSESALILTTTIAIYGAPGEAFGKTVEYDGVIFNVPEEYRGIINKALIMDSSTISIKHSSGKTLLDGRVLKALDFPTKNGWYATDEDTG